MQEAIDFEVRAQRAMQLRPYQEEAVRAVLGALRDNPSTLLVLPTGCGKTITFAEITRRVVVNNARVLILAHRGELLTQAADKIQQYAGSKIRCQVEQAGERASLKSDVVCASVQSMVGRLSRWPSDHFKIVIIDEAHHATATTYRKILAHFSGARVLGVTATPDRGDGVGLRNVFSTVAYEYGIQEAIKAGYLSPIRQKTIMVEGLDLRAVRRNRGDLSLADLEAQLMQDASLHGVVGPLLAERGDRPTILFATTVAHARALAELINQYVGGSKLTAEAVDGTATQHERDRVVGSFVRGELPILVNCALFTEGFDAPPTACVAIARPTSSRALYCLSADTQIMTPDGWKGCDDTFDRAYAFETMGNRIVESDVLARVDRATTPYESWIRFDGRASFNVTDQHRMIWRERRGRQHTRTPWRFGTAINMASCGDAVEIPTAGHEAARGLGVPLDEMRFLGLVMTDGTIGKANNQITIGQSAASPVLGEIRRIIQSLGVKYTEAVKDRRGTGNNFEPTAPTVYFTISKGKPRGRAKQMIGWGDLRVASIIGKTWIPGFEDMSGDELRALLDGMHVGDGIKSRKRGWKICSARRETIDRLQSLCVRRGLTASVLEAGNNVVLLSVEEVTARTIPTSRTDRPRIQATPARGERTWCIETDFGTIITRRNGRVAIMGNCQMIGRGFRIAPGKTDLLVLDFVGNAGKHRLVNALDVLAGDDIPDGVRKRAQQLADEGADAMDALDDAAREAKEEEARAVLIADAKYKAKHVDPFAVLGVTKRKGFGHAPPTDGQLAMLSKAMGRDLPEDIDRRGASSLIDAIIKRRTAGQCSYKQARILAKHGLRDTVSFDEAKAAIDAIQENGWRCPPHLLADPRYQPNGAP